MHSYRLENRAFSRGSKPARSSESSKVPREDRRAIAPERKVGREGEGGWRRLRVKETERDRERERGAEVRSSGAMGVGANAISCTHVQPR